MNDDEIRVAVSELFNKARNTGFARERVMQAPLSTEVFPALNGVYPAGVTVADIEKGRLGAAFLLDSGKMSSVHVMNLDFTFVYRTAQHNQ